VAQKPKVRQAAFDELVKKREAGTLDDYVKAQVAAHCKK